MNLPRFPIAALAALALLCCVVTPGTSRALAQSAQTVPDNSKQNKEHSQTADNQQNTKADRMTTANIRKAIVADKDLSTYAHNVKIITMNGEVTLKGPVKSEEEKQKVASYATGIVSADKVTNALTVKQ